MSEAQEASAKGTPKHLWVIGIIALLWNAMGAVDYVLTQTRNEGYMAKFTPEQLDFFYAFPAWLVAFWAVWQDVEQLDGCVKPHNRFGIGRPLHRLVAG